MKRRVLFFVITIVLGVLIIASGFLISAYVRAQLANNLINQYAQQEGVVAHQISQTLALEIAQAQEKLTLIAKLPDVMSGATSTCNAALNALVNDPEVKLGNLGRVDADGYFHCSVNQKLIGTKADAIGPYIDIIFNDPEHQPVMSRVVKPAGATSYLVAIHVPVWGADGTFMGTVGGAIYLDSLEKKYFDKANLPPGASVSLYDDDGTTLFNAKTELIGLNLASPDFQKYISGGLPPQQVIHDIQNGVSGTRRYSFDNAEKIAAFQPVTIFPGRMWRVSIVVPIKDAQDSIAVIGINGLLTEIPIILGVLIAALFSFFVWAITREVFQPMEAIDRTKSEFVSLASHQLRTPLSAINWYAEMLLAGDAGILNPKQKKYLDEIYSGNKRMVELVNALLDVSRLELGTFAVEPQVTDVTALAESVINEQKSAVEQKKLILTSSVMKDIPMVEVDPKLLRIIFQNLLSNAVKYTPEHGTIEFNLSLLDKKTICCKVKDSGYGITASQQDKIFTKLFRADNVREKDTEGTGLGLYMVKSIVDQCGGRIWFESKINEGTAFHVEIPLDGMKFKSKKVIHHNS